MLHILETAAIFSRPKDLYSQKASLHKQGFLSVLQNI